MSDTDFQQTNPLAISRLIELNAEPQQLWKPEELGEIVAHQLEAPASTASFGSGAHADPAMPKMTLRQLFEATNPPIDLLRAIQRAAKADCSSTTALLPRDAALIIYYACIASALVHLNERISDLDNAKLKQAFAWSLKRKWLDKGLGELFNQANAKI